MMFNTIFHISSLQLSNQNNNVLFFSFSIGIRLEPPAIVPEPYHIDIYTFYRFLLSQKT